jgi:hypothetical protein
VTYKTSPTDPLANNEEDAFSEKRAQTEKGFKKKNQIVKYCIQCILLFMVLAAVYLNVLMFKTAITEGSSDFQWQPTRELLQRQNPYESYLSGHYFMAQTPFYPLTGYIFLIPYAVMDWEYAKIAWALTNYLATFVLLYCLQKLWKIENTIIVIFLCSAFLISRPYRYVICYGQHDLYVLALFVWSSVATLKNKYLGGILLGLSWFKYSTTFPLSLYFIFKQEWKSILIGIITQCVLLMVICLWLWQSPLHILTNYLDVLKDNTSYWAWKLYHHYSYVIFLVPIWWIVYFVEIRRAQS